MSETYRELSENFSTADASRPRMTYDQGNLLLQFTDWREKLVEIQFPFAIAFRWQDEAMLPGEIRDDSSYEVIGSKWLNELTQLDITEARHRHFKLCFNAQGVLDVVSDSLIIHTSGEA
jgi:hypothetical protein